MDTIYQDPVEPQNARPVARLYTYVEDIASNPRNAPARLDAIRDILDAIPREDRLKNLIDEAFRADRNGETVLHTAIKLFSCNTVVEKKLIELLVKRFPQLVLQDRRDTDYDGQTPLHMAVCKGSIWIVTFILEELSRKKTEHWKATLFKKRANGAIFHNTVMMGELLLSIAALGCNKGVFDLLLDNGAELDGVNRHGDTVCHSLIKYAYLYKDKLGDILEMCRYISEGPTLTDTMFVRNETFIETGAFVIDGSLHNDPEVTKNRTLLQNRKLRKKIWLMENEEGLSPLQLSAKLGQHELFGFIMKLEVYCSDNFKDGLFDIKVHDVTEIDAIAAMTPEEIAGADSKAVKTSIPENVPVRTTTKTHTKSCNKSVLMMLLDLEPKCAFQFLQFPQLRRIIYKKWYAYRILFYLWWIFHFTFICFLTWYAVERAQQNHNSDTGYDVNLKPNFKKRTSKDTFVTTFGAIALLFSFIYFTQELVRMVKGKMPWTFNSFVNPYSNGWFRVMFISMSTCLVIDYFASIWSEYYENYCLILAVIISWFSIIFFIRVIRPFSFFTVLILKVLIGDMLRFFVILALELVAFSTAMYMIIQGSDVIEDTDFSDFGRVFLSMFKLMVGLGEVAALYNTRQPALAILIFVGFVIMTTLLMLNALIAMMSGTCSELVQNVGNVSARDRHWKLQRLSMILFIESILPLRMIFKVGKEVEKLRYNNHTHRRKKMRRFMLEVRSLDDEANNEHEETDSNWGFRTAVFNALNNKHLSNDSGERIRPLSAVSDKIRQIIKRDRKERRVSKKTKIKSESAGDAGKGERDHYAEAENVTEADNYVFNTTRTSDDLQTQVQRLEIYSVAKCDQCKDVKVSGSK